MRVNARLDEDLASKLDYLRGRTGASVTDVIKEAVERYYAQVRAAPENPVDILARNAFIGCGEAEPDLSRDYKRHLGDLLDAKHGHR